MYRLVMLLLSPVQINQLPHAGHACTAALAL